MDRGFGMDTLLIKRINLKAINYLKQKNLFREAAITSKAVLTTSIETPVFYSFFFALDFYRDTR